MPIYEFICEECGEEFEELVRNTAVIQDVVCPYCLGQQVIKKISAFAAPAAGGKATSYWGSSPSSCNTGSL